ncbi:MAG: lactamase [Chloroflexota bacterium]|nr:MAG: lactamase [Chloroflexota bacterium]
MEIVWHGHSFFRIRAREATIVFDPNGRSKAGRVQADLALVSHDHPGHNNVEAITGASRVLTRPGEYEIRGVSIVGVQAAHDADGGRKRGRNIAWIVHAEDISVCHLGDLGHPITSDQAQAIGAIDILLVPVGGHNTINAAQAAEIVTTLEPRVVIPMHFAQPGSDSALATVDGFLREQGARGIEPQPRYAVSSRAALPPETQVFLLEPR